MALLSAIVAHLVEISFSFTVETTLLYFWSYAALALLIGVPSSAFGLVGCPNSDLQRNAPVTRHETAQVALHGRLSPASGVGQPCSDRTASRLAPPAERWTCEEMLARLQADLNDRNSARAHIQRAIELAPVNKQETLRKLQAEIGASVSR